MLHILYLLLLYIPMDMIRFKRSEYSKQTGLGYLKTRLNKGNYGEYLTYRKLKKVRGYSRILMNAYVPKYSGGTSEIDAILIHERGIVVIESKNYGGWIYGDETYTNWVQTFKNGDRYPFYNPIMQNRTHIKHLKNNLRKLYLEDYFSLVVFSERCTLKKITYKKDMTRVLKRNKMKRFIKKRMRRSKIRLTRDEVDTIYEHLLPFTMAGRKTRKSHVAKIKRRRFLRSL